MREYFCALVFAIVAFIGISIANENEWKTAQDVHASQPTLVHAFLQTEGKTQYEIIGTLQPFRYYPDNSGFVILCFRALEISGLPELGESDEILADGFDRDPCSPL